MKSTFLSLPSLGLRLPVAMGLRAADKEARILNGRSHLEACARLSNYVLLALLLPQLSLLLLAPFNQFQSPLSLSILVFLSFLIPITSSQNALHKNNSGHVASYVHRSELLSWRRGKFYLAHSSGGFSHAQSAPLLLSLR